MKTIEEKAKAYDKALEKAEKALEVCGTDKCETARQIFSLFPELKESEDERIRKRILLSVEKDLMAHKNSGCDTKDLENCIAWLGKQGEQKPTYKVEPKFKVGDWVVSDDKDVHDDYRVCKITKIVDGRYYIEGGDFISESSLAQYEYRLWTIQDAKDGDVLQLGKVTAIFQEYIGNGNCKCYCSVCDLEFEIPSQGDDDNSYGCHNAKPATKEQRDTLMKAMADAGYSFDFEKKELKLLITNGGDFLESENREQNPAWSEEDKNFMYDALSNLTELKDRYGEGYGNVGKCIDWLKSLKDRYTWKPSEEQIECLHDAINHYQTNGYPASKLNELYEQMSKIYKL